MDFSRNKILIIAAGIVLLIACSIPFLWIGLSSSGGGIWMIADAGKGREPTPFQPFELTATPTRDIQPITNALVPNPGLIPPDGQFNVLLLGSDWRPGAGYRTDVVLLISIFTKEGKVSLVSFPRDLWIEIPGSEENRINTVMQAGGFPLVVETFERNFAIHVDRYMMTNFSGFRAIVDTLGGIDIDASKNTADRCDLSYQHGAWCSIGPGAAHLDGEMALWYVRSRYTSNDFDRTRRAQEVMVGLFRKLMSLDAISRAPDIYNQFISAVETDISLNDVLPILNIAPSILQDQSRIRRYAISTEHVTSHTTLGGAAVLLPNYEAIWQVIQEAVYTP
jgi:LCP family protein required for cell wall assembly